MAENLGRAILEIGADDKELIRALERAEKRSEQFVANLEGMVKQLESTIAKREAGMAQLHASVKSVADTVEGNFSRAFKSATVSINAAGKTTERITYQSQQAADAANRLKEAQLATAATTNRLKEAQLAALRQTAQYREEKHKLAQQTAEVRLRTAQLREEQAKQNAKLPTLRESVARLADNMRGLSQSVQNVADKMPGAGAAAYGAAQNGFNALRTVLGVLGSAALGGFGAVASAAGHVVNVLVTVGARAGGLAQGALSALTNAALALGRGLSTVAASAGTVAAQGLTRFASAAGGAALSGIQRFAAAVGGAAVTGLQTLSSTATHTAGVLVSLGQKAASAAHHLLTLGANAGGKAAGGLFALGEKATSVALSIAKVGAAAYATASGLTTAFAVKSVAAFGEFESAMLQIKAVSDLTDSQLKQLNDRALELGARFPISATDAAKGFAALAKAGFTANEVLAASNGLVHLSIAGQMDLASASDLLAGTIRGFGLAAKDATLVADLLAATANASAVDLTDLGYTFKYIAPAAAAAGFSIQEMAVAAGILGNNMIKGEQAGTSLRTIITSFSAPSDKATAALEALGVVTKDAAGNMRPFSSIVSDLRSRFKGLSEAQQIETAKMMVGQEALSAFLALMRASDADLAGMTQAVNNSGGAAERMASTMSGGVKGALDELRGSVEVMSLKLGEALAPAVIKVAGVLSKLVDAATPFVARVGAQFADRVITLVTQLQNFEQTLGYLHARFYPVIAGALQLYNVLNPLSLVIDLLRGYLDGGLNGALMVVENRIAQIGAVFGLNLLPAIKLVTGFITGVALPVLQAVAGFVLNELIPNLLAFAERVQGDVRQAFEYIGAIARNVIFGILLPALQFAITFVTSVVLPGLRDLSAWFASVFPKALDTTSDILYGRVIPALQETAGWLRRHILPIGRSVAQTFQTQINPALSTFAGIFQTKILDLFERFAAFTANRLVPTFGAIAAFFLTTGARAFTFLAEVLNLALGPAVNTVTDVIRNNLLPTATSLWNLFETKLGPKVREVAGLFGQELAHYIGLAEQKFSELQPHLEQLWTKFGPIISEIWRFVTTFSPLNIALNTMKGFLEGGIPGAVEAFKTSIGKAKASLEELMPKVLAIVGDLLPKIIGAVREFAPKFLSGLLEMGQKFLNWIEPYVPGVINEIGKLLAALLSWIGENAPKMASTLLQWAVKLVEWIGPQIPPLLAELGKLLSNMGKWFLDNLPFILGKLGEWAKAIIEWVVPQIPPLLLELGKFVGGLLKGISDALPGIVEQLGKWGKGFVDWLFQEFPNWLKEAGKFINGILDWIKEKSPEIGAKLGEWVQAFTSWIWKDVVPKLPGFLGQVIDALIDFAKDAIPTLLQIGMDLASGIAKGLYEGAKNVPVLGQLLGLGEGIANTAIDTVDFFSGNGGRRQQEQDRDRNQKKRDDALKSYNKAKAQAEEMLRNRQIDGNVFNKYMDDLYRNYQNELAGIPAYARGTMFHPGGPALAGEAGPELVAQPGQRPFLLTEPLFMPNLARGSQVFSADMTAALMSAARRSTASNSEMLGVAAGGAGASMGGAVTNNSSVRNVNNNSSRESKTIIQQNHFENTIQTTEAAQEVISNLEEADLLLRD
jgi:TP901 family phage tail tape measure protein